MRAPAVLACIPDAAQAGHLVRVPRAGTPNSGAATDGARSEQLSTGCSLRLWGGCWLNERKRSPRVAGSQHDAGDGPIAEGLVLPTSLPFTSSSEERAQGRQRQRVCTATGRSSWGGPQLQPGALDAMQGGLEHQCSAAAQGRPAGAIASHPPPAARRPPALLVDSSFCLTPTGHHGSRPATV